MKFGTSLKSKSYLLMAPLVDAGRQVGAFHNVRLDLQRAGKVQAGDRGAPNSPAEQPPAAAGMASDSSADEWTDVGL